jgi:micrococcal nuclease
MYEYKCRVVRVVDGNTVVCDVDLGFTVHVEVHFRLAAINAPELNTDAGKAAKVALERLLGQMPSDGSPLTITTPQTIVVRSEKPLQTDKYGRWLGHFYAGSTDVNATMIASGYAKVYP